MPFLSSTLGHTCSLGSLSPHFFFFFILGLQSSWPNFNVKKWLNKRSNGDSFHSDYSLPGKIRFGCFLLLILPLKFWTFDLIFRGVKTRISRQFEGQIGGRWVSVVWLDMVMEQKEVTLIRVPEICYRGPGSHQGRFPLSLPRGWLILSNSIWPMIAVPAAA